VFIFRLFKPATFSDCLGDELPFGWEIACDPQVGTYYINHVTSEMLLLSLCLSFMRSDIARLIVTPLLRPC